MDVWGTVHEHVPTLTCWSKDGVFADFGLYLPLLTGDLLELLLMAVVHLFGGARQQLLLHRHGQDLLLQFLNHLLLSLNRSLELRNFC